MRFSFQFFFAVRTQFVTRFKKYRTSLNDYQIQYSLEKIRKTHCLKHRDLNNNNKDNSLYFCYKIKYSNHISCVVLECFGIRVTCRSIDSPHINNKEKTIFRSYKKKEKWLNIGKWQVAGGGGKEKRKAGSDNSLNWNFWERARNHVASLNYSRSHWYLFYVKLFRKKAHKCRSFCLLTTDSHLEAAL